MPGRNFTDAEEAEIAQLYLSGKSAREIAKDRGLGHHISICAALKRQGIEQRPAPERNRFYKLNPNVFDVIDTEEKAYWFGMLFADGYVHRNRTLVLALGDKDRDHLVKFKDFLESESPIKEVSSFNGLYHGFSVSVTDQHLGKVLVDRGIYAHRKNDNVNPLPSVSEGLKQHWLRGWFDGDGGVLSNRSISFCGPLSLTEDAQKIFADISGSKVSIYQHTKTRYLYYLRYTIGYAIKIRDYLYQDATIYLDRKKELLGGFAVKTK